MSIKYAILGILSYKSFTGYELKKIIQDSPFMHWSGNNNQIYKSLLELQDEGFVTSEVQHQESSPSKKIYTISEDGLKELKEWVTSSPVVPEFKNTFLVQLAWSEQLNSDELNKLISNYEVEIKMQLLLHQEKIRRGTLNPNRTPREKIIWDMIYENITSSLENELRWISDLKNKLKSFDDEVKKMNYSVVEKNNQIYIDCSSIEISISNEKDALDLIVACIENKTNLLLINSGIMSDEFFDLKTGFAGNIMQKFANYHIKLALILEDKQKIKGKFKEFLIESNRGNSFRTFTNKEEAEKWLLNF